MGLEPALAIVVITLFVCCIVWGRTAGGQEVLTRVFGPPPPPPPRTPKPKRRTAVSGEKPAAPRAAGRSRRPATKRDRRR